MEHTHLRLNMRYIRQHLWGFVPQPDMSSHRLQMMPQFRLLDKINSIPWVITTAWNVFNPCHSKHFYEEHWMYIHFFQFLNNETAEVIEALPRTWKT